jgi:hypothetical protein
MAEDARIITVKKIDEERWPASAWLEQIVKHARKAHAPRHKPTPRASHGTRTRRNLPRSRKRTA